MGTANLTTMPRLVCIQVAILMLAMSFTLAESNSAPDWVGGCTKPPECPKECKSGDASHTVCVKACTHKLEYSSNKGPYKCSTSSCQGKEEAQSSKFWCPKEAQTNAVKALLSIKDAGGKFPTQSNQVKGHKKQCMPSNYGKNDETKPVPLKFMENEPHKTRTTKTDSTSWSSDDEVKTGKGIEMYPWVTPGVSNCAPKSKKPAGDFVKYFEDLKAYTDPKDKIGKDCYMIGRKEKNGISTAEALRKAGRCKFNIAGKKWCVTEQSFFCAKTDDMTTTVYETVRVDKVNKNGRKRKSNYSTLK